MSKLFFDAIQRNGRILYDVVKKRSGNEILIIVAKSLCNYHCFDRMQDVWPVCTFSELAGVRLGRELNGFFDFVHSASLLSQ
jgi:hypothetical protein